MIWKACGGTADETEREEWTSFQDLLGWEIKGKLLIMIYGSQSLLMGL